MQISEFITKYKDITTPNEFLKEEVSIAGRIMSIRAASSKLMFYDLVGDNGAKIQVFANATFHEGDFKAAHINIRRGDIVGIVGFPGRTKPGALSISVKSICQISYCLHMLPTSISKLKKQ